MSKRRSHNDNKPIQNDNRNIMNKKAIERAHRQADRDMNRDPDLGIDDKKNDLDEGELARLGGDRNNLV